MEVTEVAPEAEPLSVEEFNARFEVRISRFQQAPVEDGEAEPRTDVSFDVVHRESRRGMRIGALVPRLPSDPEEDASAVVTRAWAAVGRDVRDWATAVVRGTPLPGEAGAAAAAAAAAEARA